NHLSTILGANCFIVASSGAPMIDIYYSLKEALTKCNPKLVVVETYGIGDKKVRELKAGNLSNEYKSFSSRRNFFQKLLSTPLLFSSDNYLSAWSTSIRNHDFIFKDPDQIKKNRDGKNVLHKKKDLELGRFIRFTSGITEKTDSLYDVQGPVVDGNEFRVNRENYDALKKVQALCNKKGIPQVYLTIPMYEKHVTNYPHWKTVVSRVLGSGCQWLDLQEDYDKAVFTKECFEDTMGENQHLSVKGSLMCDYKLANYIIDKVDVTLPDRHESEEWRKLFYNEYGYFEHYSVEPGDSKNFLLMRKANVEGVLIKDCILAPVEKGSEFLMKIDKRSETDYFKDGLYIHVDGVKDGELKNYKVLLSMTPGIEPHDHYLLTCYAPDLKDLTSARLVSLGLVDPSLK
ncbi:MAG: hypothetical protein IK076_05290, partial [Bacteroidales bacterium]|nr:hypothetical protein [Bacteroidales bacterium]